MFLGGNHRSEWIGGSLFFIHDIVPALVPHAGPLPGLACYAPAHCTPLWQGVAVAVRLSLSFSMDSTHTYERSLPPHPRIHDRRDVQVCDVIGDVHGCYDELAELLTKLGHHDLLDPAIPPAPDGARPRVIFVGDIVDRGDKIVEALRLVHRLCTRGYALTVVGNHDDRFLRWLSGRKMEIQHGLEESVAQFNRLPEAERESWREELLEFLSELPWAIRIDDGRAIVAHAAWRAGLDAERSPERIRAYTLYGPVTGNLTSEGFPERIDWAPGYEGPELVIFGHQVYDSPYLHDFAIGIDTGCVFGGALTALRYPGLEVCSVKSRGARYHRRGGKV